MNITVEHLTAGYGTKNILEDISFTAKSGELTVVIGRNGAGKSTLASCLAGEKRDYRGLITLDGKNLKSIHASERARLLAYLPQVLPRPHITVRELAAFGRAPYLSFGGHLSAADLEAADLAIRSVGMENFSDAFVDRLSGGERKKAFFAMTLAQDTPAILLDEPTAHLDIVSRFEFLDLLTKLKQETGKIFLVIMHELTEVLRSADQIIAIHGRQIVFCGNAAQCLAQQIPQRCFQISITGSAETGYAAKPL